MLRIAMPVFFLTWTALLLAACPGGPCGSTPELCLLVEEDGPAYLSVRAPSSDDVWIVGTERVPQESGPTALHWNGVDWSLLDGLDAFAGAELWWVHPGESHVFLVGSQGLILEYDLEREELEVVDGIPTDITFFGVWGSSDSDVWAVGGVVGGAAPPALWRRVGDVWSSVSSEAMSMPGQIWFKVEGRSQNEVWFVGSGGMTAHFDGSDFTLHSAAGLVGSVPLFTVAVEEERVLAVGGMAGGVILEWEEGSWTDLSPAFSSPINGVCAGAGREHAVGAQGSVYRRDQEAWSTEFSDLTLRDYHACDVSPEGEVWAVGGQIVSRPLNSGTIAYAGTQGVSSPAAAGQD